MARFVCSSVNFADVLTFVSSLLFVQASITSSQRSIRSSLSIRFSLIVHLRIVFVNKCNRQLIMSMNSGSVVVCVSVCDCFQFVQMNSSVCDFFSCTNTYSNAITGNRHINIYWHMIFDNHMRKAEFNYSPMQSTATMTNDQHLLAFAFALFQCKIRK